MSGLAEGQAQGVLEVCSQNLGDDTAKDRFNTIIIRHLPIIQQTLIVQRSLGATVELCHKKGVPLAVEGVGDAVGRFHRRFLV